MFYYKLINIKLVIKVIRLDINIYQQLGTKHLIITVLAIEISVCSRFKALENSFL